MRWLPAALAESMRSPSFIEKSLLLFLTAGLTGVVVPVVGARLAEDRAREQTIFQADIARQQKIIDAQSAFFDRFADLVWEFQLLHIDVSFRRLLRDEAGYLAAVDRYKARSAEVLGRLRGEISKGRRLMSMAASGSLKTLYEETLLSGDAELEGLITSSDSSEASWKAHHEAMLGGATRAIDGALDALATDMNIRAGGR